MSFGSRSARRSLACLTLGCALVASVLTGCGRSPDGGGTGRENFEQYTLGNGLKVILRKDDRLPIAAVNLWYHVGPANEVAGRTGFAHLFEHLMLTGSGHIPAGEAEKLLDAVGATDVNANTNFDRTKYYETVPSNALETALWRESDRMGFLLDALDQAKLSNQQSVVRNERRQNRESAALKPTEEAMYRGLFPPGHPYHADVLGSHADIQAARLDEARDFFRRYYVPNNASLAVVGNIDVAVAKAMIEKYFGSIPRGADMPAPQVDTPALTGEKRLTMTENLLFSQVTMAWITPPPFAPGDAEALVAAHLLGGGPASRLYDALVRRDKIAQGVMASQTSLALGSVFKIEAAVTPGHNPQELEAAIQRELDRLKNDGPTPAELTAAQAAIRTDLLSTMEHPAGWADALNSYNHYIGDPNYLDRDLRRYTDVRADAVQRFAAEQLRGDRRLVIHTTPGATVLPPEPPTPPTPPADPPPAPSAEPWRATAPQPGPVSTAPLPRAQRFELANGLPVYLLESHTVPLVVGSIISRWGSAADPSGQPGLAGLTVGMLDQGTAGRDELGIARELDALGATLSTTVGIDGGTASVSALSEKIGPAMAVMSDVVRSPAFPPAEVEARRGVLAGYEHGTIAERVMRREVYGQDHPYGHLTWDSEQAVRPISRDDLITFHRRAFTPRTCALVLAGDLRQDQARTLAEDAFGSWTGAGADPQSPGPPTPTPNRVLVVDRSGSGQTTLLLAQPGVALRDPDHDKLLVLNQVLGSGFSSRLNLNLRQSHGYTYWASSALSGDRGVGTFTLSTDVQTAFTGPSVREMLGEVAGLQNAPVTAEELDRAKQSIIRTVPGNFVTNADTAAAIRYLYLYDLPPDYYEQLPARVATIDAAQLQEAARTHLRPQEMKVVAVGDESTIAPQLEALNLGPIAYRNADGSPTP